MERPGRHAHGVQDHERVARGAPVVESKADEAHRLALGTRGDPVALGALVATLSPDLLAQVIEVAQQIFGNAVVRAALAHAEAPLAAARDVAAGTDGALTGGVGGAVDRLGLHGAAAAAGGLTMVGGDGDRRPTITSVGRFGGAEQMRYGDTFGGERMAGHDAGLEAQLTVLGGHRRSQGDDQRGTTSLPDGQSSTDTAKTPAATGAPSALAYPGSGPTSDGTATSVTSRPGNDAGVGGGAPSATTSQPHGLYRAEVASTGDHSRYIKPKGVRTPTDDADGGGTGAPVVVNRGAAGSVANTLRRERARHTAADGSGDDRAGTAGVGGGTSAMMVTRRTQVDGEVEHDTSKLDLDRALAINQLVNPGRT